MKVSELPDWSFCYEHVKAETAGALETFIAENEPAGIEETKVFREQLSALLTEARAYFESEPCRCAKCLPEPQPEQRK